MAKILLKGSERSPLPGARIVAPANPDERLEVSVLVRRRGHQAMQARVAQLAAGKRVAQLSREEFAREHGADPSDFAKVRAFAESQGLKVLEEHAARRTVILSGTVAQFSAAFGVQLHHVSCAGCTYRGRTGGIYLAGRVGRRGRGRSRTRQPPAGPASLSHPPARGQHQPARPRGVRHRTPRRRWRAFTGIRAATAPASASRSSNSAAATGPRTSARISAVSASPHLRSARSRSIRRRTVPPAMPTGPDGEVMLDIEVVGAIAPRRTHRGVLRAQHRCGLSRCDHHRDPRHDQQAVRHLHQLGRRGVDLDGAGDDGHGRCVPGRRDLGHHGVRRVRATAAPADGVSDGGDHVDFPASSPTRSPAAARSLQAARRGIASETVWNDGASGGASGRRHQQLLRRASVAART